ncbi:YpmS family protein [Bacillus carboniphilus]|uniref:YpmS family protein n=1 Tax=Bacillus carboniphilus TaxID=86663 RepID=A0ABY9JZA4_9BACI|nr:YpmS family protein [Bacillus carboniphilus]WLR43668.1 YpmS family protein [Bacillus carboniphilus]
MLLLALNVLSISTLFVLLFTNSSEPELELDEPISMDRYAEISLESDLEAVERIINQFLEKESNNQPLQYQVIVNDKVRVVGKIVAFGKDINMTMDLIPIVTEEGNVQLKVDDLTLGSFSLPVSFVLNYVNSQYAIPNEVVIDKEEESIYVLLTELEVGSGYKIKANDINLEEERVEVTLLIPQ